nr:hypothetical protein B0A51_08594 [Rachicladosporium sp. CCFEE 5018]
MSSQCPCYECDYVRRGYGPPYYPCARYTPRFRKFPPNGFTPQPRVLLGQHGYASMAGFGGTGLTPQAYGGLGMAPGMFGGSMGAGLTPPLRPPFLPPPRLTPGVPYGNPWMMGTGMTPRPGYDDRDYPARQEMSDILRRGSEAYDRRYREEREQRTPRPGPTADRRTGRGPQRPPFGAEDREPSYFHSDSIRSGRTPQVPTSKTKFDTPVSRLDARPRRSHLHYPIRVYDDEELDILRQERRDLTAENFDLRRRLRETKGTLAQSRMQEQWLRDDLTEEMLAREFAFLQGEDAMEKSITGVASTQTEGPKSATTGGVAKQQADPESAGAPAATADAETQTIDEDEKSSDVSKTKDDEETNFSFATYISRLSVMTEAIDDRAPLLAFRNRYIDPTGAPLLEHVLAMNVLTDEAIEHMLDEPGWLPLDWDGADDLPEVMPLLVSAALVGSRLATAGEIRRGLAERNDDLPVPREDGHDRAAQLALVRTAEQVQNIARGFRDFLQIEPAGPDMIAMHNHRKIVGALVQLQVQQGEEGRRMRRELQELWAENAALREARRPAEEAVWAIIIREPADEAVIEQGQPIAEVEHQIDSGEVGVD